jgi:hypothetical protein
MHTWHGTDMAYKLIKEELKELNIEWNGTEQNGTEWNGMEHNRTEWNGMERNITE